MPEPRASVEEEFWRFSVAFYGYPGVAPALLALQDRDGLDVNLMLFALWFGISGRGQLNSEALAAADRAIGGIRAEIVEPLRTLRRKLKDHRDADVQRLRDQVKELELQGEKLAQTRLARLAGISLSDICEKDPLATGLANFNLYLGPLKAHSAEAAVIRDGLKLLIRSETGEL